MKKILALVLLSSALLFSSCNKNKKFNKVLDGTWISTVEDGQTVSSDDATKLIFSKSEKDGGNVTIITYEDGDQSSQGTGTYKVSEKGETLTIDATGTTAASGSSPSGTFTYHATGKVTDQDKTKFTWNSTATIASTGGIGLSFTGTTIMQFSKQ